MAKGEIRVGQILPLIFLVKDQDDQIVNLAPASSKKIVIRKPDLDEITVDASFTLDGTDGYMQYVTIEENLAQEGDYKAQGIVVVAGITYPSDIVDFHVHANL